MVSDDADMKGFFIVDVSASAKRYSWVSEGSSENVHAKSSQNVRQEQLEIGAPTTTKQRIFNRSEYTAKFV